MANVSSSNLTSKFSNTIVDQELSSLAKASYIISIIFNSIACPFTVLLNVLVILAVKSRPLLQSKPNILLACLAVTDAMNGLVAQPVFISATTLKLFHITSYSREVSVRYQNISSRVLYVCSALHLMLVTGERLVAIKFTMRYPYVVTNRNIKVAVIAFWIVCLCSEQATLITDQTIFTNAFTGLVLTSCVLFILVSYVILYRETRRHENKIKAGQLPQEEKERFLRDRKALKTTVYVVGAVLLCLTPAAAWLLVSSFLRVLAEELWAQMTHDQLRKTIGPTVRTFVYLNSLINPLIYCWRQKEIRKYVFNKFCKSQDVHPVN